MTRFDCAMMRRFQRCDGRCLGTMWLLVDADVVARIAFFLFGWARATAGGNRDGNGNRDGELAPESAMVRRHFFRFIHGLRGNDGGDVARSAAAAHRRRTIIAGDNDAGAAEV